MSLRYCSVCGHDVRDYARHVTSREHLRKLHPIGSRRGARANAKRARRRLVDDSQDWYDRMWAMAGEVFGRHFYGAWTPWGRSKAQGGHPARRRR